jgi:hypothetical protein
MDFVDWCGLVLQKLSEVTDDSPDTHLYGVHWLVIAAALFGEDVTLAADFATSSRALALEDGSLEQLSYNALAEETGLRCWRPTELAEQIAGDFVPLWEAICSTGIRGDRQTVLGVVNRLSHRAAPDHAWIEWVSEDALLAELGWADSKRLFAVAKRLEDQQLIEVTPVMGPTVTRATYRGLVWETRRGFSTEARFIDQLVDEWETTSVEFKADVQTDTARQKAEFVKDILGLANTQASGKRWLMLGFDGKTRRYVGPPNPKLSQDHLEQLLSEYIQPSVDVVYQIVDYRGGRVGKIEVLRDRRKLPYRVKHSINGDTRQSSRRIEVGEVFIRHGSQTMRASQEEITALENERKWSETAT